MPTVFREHPLRRILRRKPRLEAGDAGASNDVTAVQAELESARLDVDGQFVSPVFSSGSPYHPYVGCSRERMVTDRALIRKGRFFALGETKGESAKLGYAISIAIACRLAAVCAQAELASAQAELGARITPSCGPPRPRWRQPG